MTRETMAVSVKEKAAALGFNLCGITTALPPPHHASYRQWLDEGHSGEMEYLKRHEPVRSDPSRYLPGAKSVIMVALNYFAGDQAAGDGVIARYARCDDYHTTMLERLSRMLQHLQQIAPGSLGRIFSDTAPVSERDLAMRAGIGWIGKHTNLISQRLGNWFFLGGMVVDADLPPDAPQTPHCGTCSRCIPACPTGAITAPYVLDARRCISYLTIELKGSIPVELRPLVGNRVFGCDDCLAACPWNKFAPITRDPQVRPRADLVEPDLVELLAMDDAVFRARFRNSPILRAKRRGFVRNVCVALGNVATESAIPPLQKALGDPEPLVREHAQWAMDQIGARGKSGVP